MNNINIKKLCMAGLLTALAVVGSTFSFPAFGSKCAPVQHMVNIMSAILLGPMYALTVAFSASLIRNLLGLGSLLAFPGSMIGAFLAGLMYKKSSSIYLAAGAELVGTAVLGGLCAYPVAILFMGKNAADIAFYAYVIPFLISTGAGAVFSVILLGVMEKSSVLSNIKNSLA